MDLKIKGKKFLVLGASSGFGRHIAERICDEGGHPVLVARSTGDLEDFHGKHTDSSIIAADLFTPEGVEKVENMTRDLVLDGALINAGGPPSGSFPMGGMEDWDQGYRMVLRWKIDLLRRLLPRFQSAGYGRLVFMESISVKEPIPGLVLSNVFRMAVAGLMKSIVNEMKEKDILLNMIAPGYHMTSRLESLITGQSQARGIPVEKVATGMAENTTLKKLGDPASLAELAVWLLSPQNSYVTGQIISVDGGLVKAL